MSKLADRKLLIEAVSTLLRQKAATDIDFFPELVEEMERYGYTIEAHQNGIRGVFLRVVKLPV